MFMGSSELVNAVYHYGLTRGAEALSRRTVIVTCYCPNRAAYSIGKREVASLTAYQLQ
jgi:hypothetical protein